MKLKYLSHTLLLVATLLASCNIQKDYFGESVDANITKFTIANQLSVRIQPLVNHADTGLVTVVMPLGTDLSQLNVQQFVISDLAQTQANLLDSVDFSSPVHLKIMAENHNYTKCWKITVEEEPEPLPGEGPQIAFASMTQWSPMLAGNGAEITLKDGTAAYAPGDGTTPIWSTAAEANAYSLSGINYITAYPMPGAGAAKYARMETVQSKVAATFAKSGVVAGALFTGNFVFNPKWGMPATSAPRKMVNLGTPFAGRPKQVTFQYRYAPGAIMKDGLLNDITASNAEGRATKDSCEIYFILHNRQQPEQWQRVGAAMLRSGEFVGDMKDDNTFYTVTLDFVYGKPTAAQLTEKPYMNIGGVRGELTFYNFTSNEGVMEPSENPVEELFVTTPDEVAVTHLSVMFSSSAYGDKFWAATNGEPQDGMLRGSTLDIRNVAFVY